MGGPLAGLKVVEMVGLGPGPFCGMLLADMGADVLRVDRPGAGEAPWSTPRTGAMNRGKRSVAIDVKHPDGLAAFLRLADQADALIDVFRPGVAERLGIGPGVCLERNPRLIYGRLTGFGQEGPWADAAGHDIDYLALCGALEPLGRAGQPPTPPINVLADFAGGGMLLAWGITCAVVERATSGKGQVIDAAMVDGAALYMTPFFAARASGSWGERGTNFLDTGAHFYEVYETADRGWLAVGAIEPQFYAALLKGLGLGDEDPAEQWDTSSWPHKKERLAAVIRTRTRDEWCTALAGTDACVAPVLRPEEAPGHPHAVSRGAFVRRDGRPPEPAPAPRFSRTPGEVVDRGGTDGATALAPWGFAADEIAALRDRGAVGEP